MLKTCRCARFVGWTRTRVQRPAHFGKQTNGSVATEYGLIAALVVVVVIVAILQVRTNLLALPFPALIAAFTDALGG